MVFSIKSSLLSYSFFLLNHILFFDISVATDKSSTKTTTVKEIEEKEKRNLRLERDYTLQGLTLAIVFSWYLRGRFPLRFWQVIIFGSDLICFFVSFSIFLRLAFHHHEVRFLQLCTLLLSQTFKPKTERSWLYFAKQVLLMKEIYNTSLLYLNQHQLARKEKQVK